MPISDRHIQPHTLLSIFFSVSISAQGLQQYRRCTSPISSVICAGVPLEAHCSPVFRLPEHSLAYSSCDVAMYASMLVFFACSRMQPWFSFLASATKDSYECALLELFECFDMAAGRKATHISAI